MCRVFSVILFLAFTAVAVRSEDAPARDAKVVGVSPLRLTHPGNLSTEDQNFVIREIKSHKYTSTDLDEIAERIRFAMQARGYFKVLVRDPVFTVVSEDTRGRIVDVMVAIEEGRIYRLGKIGFSNTFVFTSAELREQFLMTDGEIFNREKVANGLENLRTLYGKKGYVNFSAVPQTTIDGRAILSPC
jgi:outer membrane protein assembly factor BamA